MTILDTSDIAPDDHHDGQDQPVVPASASWLDPTSIRRRVALLVVAAGAFVVVLALHGFLPGMSQPSVQAHLATGAIDCLRIEGMGAFTSYCGRIGLPVGQPLLTGLPQTYLGLFISYLPYVSSTTAHVIVDILCDAAGFAAIVLLARRWGVHPVVAIGVALAYLGSLSIVFMNGFAATFNGFVLIPVNLWLAIVAMDWIDRRRSRLLIAGVLAGNSLLAVFTDGYGFMEGLLLVSIAWLVWATRADRPLRWRLWGVGAFLASTLLAVALYLWYVPGGAYSPGTSIDVFRAMGADAATFFAPQRHLWWSRKTGIDVDFRMGWGDYGASRSNYLGVVVVALAVVAVVHRRRERLVQGLALGAVVALVLALGPSLKLYDLYHRDLSVMPTAYSMPADAATLGLPTTWLYEYVPGFSDMRATFRWVVPAILCLLLLAGSTVTRWWASGRKILAVAVGVVALIEIAPDVPTFIRVYERERNEVAAFEVGPKGEFATLVQPGERVLMLPVSNDFLANDLVPRTGASSYNIGIDKNFAYSMGAWPADVDRAWRSYGTPEGLDHTAEALAGSVDVVVFPYFDLRLQALTWPPNPGLIEQRRQAAEVYATDPRFVATRAGWFTLIRLAE